MREETRAFLAKIPKAEPVQLSRFHRLLLWLSERIPGENRVLSGEWAYIYKRGLFASGLTDRTPRVTVNGKRASFKEQLWIAGSFHYSDARHTTLTVWARFGQDEDVPFPSKIEHDGPGVRLRLLPKEPDLRIRDVEVFA